MEVKTRKKIKNILFTQRTYTEGSNGSVTQLFDSPLGSVGNVVPGYSIQLASRDKQGKWKVDNLQKLTEFYNNANGTNLPEKEVNRQFFLSIAPAANNDAANILNTNSNYSSQQTAITNRKSYAAAGIPGITDPTTGTGTNSKGQKKTQATQAPEPPAAQPPTASASPIVAGSSVQSSGSSDAAGSADAPGPISIPVIPYEEPVKEIPPEKDANSAEVNKHVLLRYPLANLDIVEKELGIGYDYIKIRIINHVSSIDSTLFLGGGTESLTDEQKADLLNRQIKNLTESSIQDVVLKNSSNPFATIILPMQPNLSTSNSADWGSDSLNIAQLIGGQLATNFFMGQASGKNPMEAMKDVTTQLTQSLGTFSSMGVANKNTIATLLAGYLVGSEGIVKRASGTVINPNMEMLFNGPRLRTFNFQFDMTPRFKEEADEIKKIIRTFKKYMSPAKTPGNVFLKTPKIFLLDYIHNGNNSGDTATGNTHPFLNKFKACALTEFNVNYTPDGSYMTYADGGSMTRYSISLSFSEIEPIYEGDYKDSDNDMGY